MKNIIILGLILCLGFALRSYHLDFPSIGYHNMKENEYLSIAEEMIRTRDFVNRRIYFYNAFQEGPIMKIYPQPPLVSYQALISWKFLGYNLWGPRLFNILFGLASIVVIYLIATLLFCEIKWTLFCAFLLAIMPLGVFFSRNLQPESPAFFFMLLGNLFYLKFISSLKKDNLFLGGLFLSIAWLYKFSFIIGILPIILCFPLKALYKNKRELTKYTLIFLSSYVIILISIAWLMYIKQWVFDYQGSTGRIKLFEVFSFEYWRNYGRIIWWYMKGENYTPIFTLLALLGAIIAIIKRKGLLNRYILGWTLSIVPYSMVFSDYINQHNYYQMPFLAMVCVSCVYTTAFFSGVAKKLLKIDFSVSLMIFISILSSAPVYLAIRNTYNKVFFGEDVAGESLKEFTAPDERIFLLTYSQGYGIARYAQRYTGWVSDLRNFREREEKYKIRYLCIYPGLFFLENLKNNNPSLFEYIQNNYRIKELGLIKHEEGYRVVYCIYKKFGKGLDVYDFLNSNLDKIKLRKVYRLPGRYITFYSVRENNT